tara:strand:- start:700 stop:1611 length:912 start_codon:yes stop_codon:yes gene_type:complete
MLSSEITKDLFLFYGVYDTEQLIINKFEFIPCIFENIFPWKHEFQIFKSIYNLVSKSKENKDCIIGLFSSSLTSRTGLNYQIVSELIQDNNADIFIFSPCQYNSLIFYNYWDQAEVCHQDIRKEIKQIFSLNEFLPKVNFNSRTAKEKFSYCNFWAAKRDFFLKIVKDMILLDELMVGNKLGLNSTTHISPYVYNFNESYKKNYKLFPFILERYLSATLMDRDNKLKPKVFYWKDERKLIDQVEQIEGLLECMKGPITRGDQYKSNKTIFKDKKDFYNKIWFSEDIEKLNKVIPGAGDRLKSL